MYDRIQTLADWAFVIKATQSQWSSMYVQLQLQALEVVIVRKQKNCVGVPNTNDDKLCSSQAAQHAFGESTAAPRLACHFVCSMQCCFACSMKKGDIN